MKPSSYILVAVLTVGGAFAEELPGSVTHDVLPSGQLLTNQPSVALHSQGEPIGTGYFIWIRCCVYNEWEGRS
jgi:hypothetical protein